MAHPTGAVGTLDWSGLTTEAHTLGWERKRVGTSYIGLNLVLVLNEYMNHKYRIMVN